ncbi:DUF6966 domain-containing protein [Salmonella enterica]|uniref:DUF6966 domain-containing protein n=1 Tax=Salmonella enterica TaxID=28901 RepID=UPI003F3B252D
MKEKIRSTINDIIIVLQDNNERYWVNIFKEYLVLLDNDYEQCIHNMKTLYGGMGSFNDLVLHKAGIPDKDENNKLDLLRHELYGLLK